MAVTFLTRGALTLGTSSLIPVSHAFTTRPGGVSSGPFSSLNLRLGHGDSVDNSRENYRIICEALSLDTSRLVISHQVHETTVRQVTLRDALSDYRDEPPYTADALITDEPGLGLCVFSADCGILLYHDPVSGAVGACHAGWRGCAAGITAKVIRELQRSFASRPEDVRVSIGPCIGQCCFETDDDVPDAMRAALGKAAEQYLEKRGAKTYVDLAGLNRLWLLGAGVLPEHIDTANRCTACESDLFWSHRRMGDLRGLQGALIICGGES